jgi:AraC-like DNA-binding protein
MILRYHYFTTEPVILPKIYSIGYASDTRVTRYGPASRDQYLIHYVISGKGVFNGTEVHEGEGFIITPEMYEHYYPDEKDPWRYVWIISYDQDIETHIEMHDPDKKTGIFKFHNIAIIEDIAKQLLLNDDVFEFSNTEITEMYLRIFNNCVKTKAKVNNSNSKMYFDYVEKYVSLNMHFSVSVNDICKKLGVSQPYLYRVFMAEKGISPKRYLSERRLREAKRQLSVTDFSISDIASSLGFSDVLAFSKFFSGKMGISPTEFRRSRLK